MKSDRPPGPPGSLVMGVLTMALKDPPGFLLASARRYGDVVSMRFGVRRVYLVSHPDGVQRVLQDQAQAYHKGPPASRVASLFGDSLTAVDGESWRQRRRLMQPPFQPHRILQIAPLVIEVAGTTLDLWANLAGRGERLDLVPEMRRMTRAIVLRMLFGEVAEIEARAVNLALDIAVNHVDRRLWSRLGLALPTPAQSRFKRALRVIDLFVASKIHEARRRVGVPGMFLSELLATHDPGGEGRILDSQLRAELKALLFAGHTTTASTLAWVWCLLSENREERLLLRQELDTVLDGRPPRIEDLRRLRRTRMVIDEALRLYPPTWLTARTPLHDDEIAGYRIPAGSIVLLSPFVTHRRADIWPDPDRFVPERFSPDRSESRPRFAYFPFGGGPRACPGTQLALTELQLIVATVAQRYKVDLDAHNCLETRAGLTLEPRRDIFMALLRDCPLR